jgi:hypothetical protein
VALIVVTVGLRDVPLLDREAPAGSGVEGARETLPEALG